MTVNNQFARQILVVVATAGVIFINYLAGTGSINNTTPAEISDKYPTMLTPAGYAFSIWGIIYLGLIAFSVYQALPSQRDNPRFIRVRTLYIANCAANCGWLYLWHFDYIGLSVVAMLFILSTLVLISLNLRGIESNAEIWTTKVPFNIYFGWITAATILNASIALVYFGVQASEIVSVILACLLIATTAALAIVIRRSFNFPSYALTIMWALIAIAVNQYADTPIFAAAIIGAIISFATAFFGRKKISY